MRSALLAAAALACTTPTDTGAATPRLGQAADALSVEGALAAGDARQLTQALRSASLHASAPVRAAAARAVGLLENDGAVTLLELALMDREPGIRLDAVAALARHPGYPASARPSTVLGAFAAASTQRERIALLGVLADVHPSAKAPWLTRALESADPQEQEAACLALARLASRGHAPDVEAVTRVVGRIEQGEGGALGACASVWAEPVARETARAAGLAERAIRALTALAGSSDLDSAVLAAVSLAADGGEPAVRALTGLSGSKSPRIALESARGSASKLGPAALAGAVERELGLRGSSTRSGRAGILLELLEALGNYPDSTEAAAVARRLQSEMGADLSGRLEAPIRLERALLHCAGARLADAVRRWPKDVFTCGEGAVSGPLRDAWTAEAFARAAGSDELRAAQLRRLFEKGPARVRSAVLDASASLPSEQASALVRLGLRSNEPAVIAAAARAIAARPGLRSMTGARVGFADLLEAAPRASTDPEAASAFIQAARALARPTPEDPIKPAHGSSQPPARELEMPAQIAEIAPPSPPAALIERVTQLARHPALAVRGPALALLSEWQVSAPVEHEPVMEPLTAERIPDSSALFHVKLETTAGAIELELDTARAPVAAVRFVERVRRGALDGLPVAQLALGRAVSFQPNEGAPLRHEHAADRVERGSVLLQDHGRDALGPGFAIVLQRAPSLDRRAGVIGRVTAGLEVADALLPVDAIVEARVSTETR